MGSVRINNGASFAGKLLGILIPVAILTYFGLDFRTDPDPPVSGDILLIVAAGMAVIGTGLLYLRGYLVLWAEADRDGVTFMGLLGPRRYPWSAVQTLWIAGTGEGEALEEMGGEGPLLSALLNPGGHPYLEFYLGGSSIYRVLGRDEQIAAVHHFAGREPLIAAGPAGDGIGSGVADHAAESAMKFVWLYTAAFGVGLMAAASRYADKRTVRLREEGAARGGETLQWVCGGSALLVVGLGLFFMLRARSEAPVAPGGARPIGSPRFRILDWVAVAVLLLGAGYMMSKPFQAPLRYHQESKNFSEQDLLELARIDHPLVEEPLDEGKLPPRTGKVLILRRSYSNRELGLEAIDMDLFVTKPELPRLWAKLSDELRATHPGEVGTLLQIRYWKDKGTLEVFDLVAKERHVSIPLGQDDIPWFEYGGKRWHLLDFAYAMPISGEAQPEPDAPDTSDPAADADAPDDGPDPVASSAGPDTPSRPPPPKPTRTHRQLLDAVRTGEGNAVVAALTEWREQRFDRSPAQRLAITRALSASDSRPAQEELLSSFRAHPPARSDTLALIEATPSPNRVRRFLLGHLAGTTTGKAAASAARRIAKLEETPDLVVLETLARLGHPKPGTLTRLIKARGAQWASRPEGRKVLAQLIEANPKLGQGLLKHRTDKVRVLACDLVADIDPRPRWVLRHLSSRLRDKAAVVRARAATCLKRVGDPRASWALARALARERLDSVKAQVLGALRALPFDRTHGYLVQLYNKDRASDRRAAVHAAAALEASAAVDVIDAALEDEDPAVCKRALQAVADWYKKPRLRRSVLPLMNAVAGVAREHDDPDLKRQAKKIHYRITGRLP